MRILGIDPALRVTGYGVIDGNGTRVRLIEAGVVSPKIGALELRLQQLYAAMVEIISQTRPNVVVIEELYTTYKSPGTAILMGHARGVLALASAQAGIPVHTIGHAHVKRALVGSGSARKEQVGAMVARMLGLRSAPSPHDVSDALALALAFHHRAGRVVPARAAKA
ncbi:MAG TPA: crossover junction endodeoxyribonuclease RuvC [Candidatus Dormibacteraeota bacterium]|nr:crossover junction endodeoxyribonuclease RuvC [Candidatus Dormibacteraeota bacterium]